MRSSKIVISNYFLPSLLFLLCTLLTTYQSVAFGQSSNSSNNGEDSLQSLLQQKVEKDKVCNAEEDPHSHDAEANELEMEDSTSDEIYESDSELLDLANFTQMVNKLQDRLSKTESFSKVQKIQSKILQQFVKLSPNTILQFKLFSKVFTDQTQYENITPVINEMRKINLDDTTENENVAIPVLSEALRVVRQSRDCRVYEQTKEALTKVLMPLALLCDL